MDYVLRLEKCEPDCWIDFDAGDAGITHEIEKATKYETENLARENASCLWSKLRCNLIIEPYNY